VKDERQRKQIFYFLFITPSLSVCVCVCVCVCVWERERERERVCTESTESLDKILLQEYFIVCLWKRMLWLFVCRRCLYIRFTFTVSHHALGVSTVSCLRTILSFFKICFRQAERQTISCFQKYTKCQTNKPKHTCKYGAHMFTNTLRMTRCTPSYLDVVINT